MFDMNPESRLSFKEVKEHPWYNKYDPQKEDVIREMKKRREQM